MSLFTGPLTITELDVDLELWRLSEPLVYEIGFLGSGKVISVPQGFVSDGASIPWPISVFLPRWGRYRRAAVLHDYLLAMLKAGTPHPFAPTRKIADGIFREALAVLEINFVVRSILYGGVRLGARFPFLGRMVSRI